MKICFPHNETCFLTTYYDLCFSQKTIYQVVEEAKRIYRKFDLQESPIDKTVLLNDIVNLHDKDGLSIEKIGSILDYLKSGRHIVPNGFPNIKLLKYGSKFILFDGHHTLLAYSLMGSYLWKTPHLTVIKEDIKSSDLDVFFGEHKSKLSSENTWEDYVINWYAPVPLQLQKRKTGNMQELLDSVIGDFGQIFNGPS